MPGDPSLHVAEGFAAAWDHPEVDRFVALLHPEVRLRQPLLTEIVGRAAARREFAALLRWQPAIHGDVDRTALDGDTVLVAWRLQLRIGRRTVEVPVVDRLIVADGLIAERDAYYDSARLAGVVARHPGSWPGFVRYRFARR